MSRLVLLFKQWKHGMIWKLPQCLHWLKILQNTSNLDIYSLHLYFVIRVYRVLCQTEKAGAFIKH